MRHSTTRTFTSGTSGPRWFSLILRMKEFEDGFDGVTFPTLIHIVAETAIVSFHTLPLVSIANNLQEFFVHAVLFLDS